MIIHMVSLDPVLDDHDRHYQSQAVLLQVNYHGPCVLWPCPLGMLVVIVCFPNNLWMSAAVGKLHAAGDHILWWASRFPNVFHSQHVHMYEYISLQFRFGRAPLLLWIASYNQHVSSYGGVHSSGWRAYQVARRWRPILMDQLYHK